MFDLTKQAAISKIEYSTARDWGQSIILRNDHHGDKVIYREKFLIFKPNASIALESHDDYDEVWIPDSKVVYYLEDEVGDIKRHVATRYERVLIRRGKKHKIINPGAVELCIFEIQLGRIEPGDKKVYLSEDSNYDK